MKYSIILLLAILSMAGTLNAQSPVVEVTTDITTFALWSSDNVYLIKGTIYVSGILVIQPGTVIKGDKATKGTLVITRTGQINANSVADDAPAIVFTSSAPEGSRAPGDWGGLIMLGQAPINAAGGTSLLGAVNNAANDGQFGGTNAAHISGSLQKVRIEYAGASLTASARVGGLTLAGVGSGTTIRNVQVTQCAADGFEIRGGTVNMNQILSHRNADDDFDLSLGYSGRVQFAVGMRDNDNVNGVNGANGLVAVNDAGGSGAIPLTSAVFSNLILVGPKVNASTVVDSDFQDGIRLSGNARVSIYNSVVMGYPNGLNIDGTATQTAASSGGFDVRRLYIAGADNDLVASGGWDIDAYFSEAARMNELFIANDSLKLQNPFNLDFPDFRPRLGSPLIGAADFSSPALSSFTAVSYMGAFSRLIDWSLCWSNWDPSNTSYDEGSELLASPIFVDFSYQGRPEDDSLTVDFTNITTGAVKYFWSFGDFSSGGADTSSLENPTWTYPSAGSYEVRLLATGPCDNQDSISVNTFIGLGLSDWLSGAQLTLFPNPAQNYVMLDLELPLEEEFNLVLYDLTGRVLRDYGSVAFPSGQFRYTMSLDGIEPGMYLLLVSGQGGFHAEKLQINR